MARTDFELQDGETLFYEGTLNHIKGKLNVTEGTGYLTNQRLVRYEASLTLKALIGLLAKLFKQKFDFEISLRDIQSIKPEQKGLYKKNAFYLTKTDGTEMRLVSFKRDDLMSAFRQAYDHHTDLSLSELSHQEWFVQGAGSHAAAD
ncbi:MAG: hypothetical protein AAF490_13175 [Chloroflexota bacterium]